LRRRTPALISAAISVTLALTGCSGSSNTPATGDTPNVPAASYPVTVGAVTLAKQPTKIVSLSPTATEMLFAIGAGKQVTAVDDQSNFPAEAPKTDLSGFKPNAEAVAAKAPDLVVLANDTNTIVAQLTALKIPVYVAPAATTIADTYSQLEALGKLTGHDEEAHDLSSQMKDDITELSSDLSQRAKKLRYYHELDQTLYTATSKTFVGSVYALLGLENIADASDPGGKSGGYPQLSAEAIVKANPDLVFLADTKCCKQSLETLKARPGWSSITAVKDNHVVALDDDIASRWGPRVVDLLRAVAGAVQAVPAG
jgi:iron complex transport system substrate-binding protein